MYITSERDYEGYGKYFIAQEYHVINNEPNTVIHEGRELYNKLVSYLLEKTTRDDDGRLTMPLLLNQHEADKLIQNHLANSGLQYLKKKFKKKEEYLKSINETLRNMNKRALLKEFLTPVNIQKSIPISDISLKPDRETTK